MDFLEDKMVGGDPTSDALLAKLAATFEKHIQWPIIKLTLTNAGDCDATDAACKLKGAKSIDGMKKTLHSIINTVYTGNGISVPVFDASDETKYITEAVDLILKTPIVGKPMKDSKLTLYVQTEDGIQGYTTENSVTVSPPDLNARVAAKIRAAISIVSAAATGAAAVPVVAAPAPAEIAEDAIIAAEFAITAAQTADGIITPSSKAAGGAGVKNADVSNVINAATAVKAEALKVKQATATGSTALSTALTTLSNALTELSKAVISP